MSGISGGLNAVINSPARRYRTPVEMSQLHPFPTRRRPLTRSISAIRSSRITYGKVLGLALDLSLRNQGQNRSLDGFMASYVGPLW